jgi:DNA-binding response OmpR family regulator
VATNILVIDDDETIVELIRAVLSEEGFRVSTALSGDEALNSPPAPPDLIVLDMFMPGTAGAELAEGLRTKYGADVPILLISASIVDREARALGAYEYLPKPFDLDELLAAIRRGLASPAE